MLFSFLFAFARSGTWEVTNATCTYDETTGYSVKAGIDKTGVAYAVYNHSMFVDGWHKLHVHGNPEFEDKHVMYCAGMVEGFLTYQGMFDHFNLIKDIKGYPRGHIYPEEVHDFMDTNRIYVKQSIQAYPDDEWWQSIGLIIQQFDGLVAGYEKGIAGNESMKMTEFDHWFFQSAGDMFDIASMFEGAVADHDYSNEDLAHEHCSGMVRLTDDYSDIYFAHDAWSDYRELHGQLKEYDLKIKSFKANKIVMSTRVGKLSSYDDYYVNDAGLFVLETTLNNYNMELYNVVVPQSLFTWLRAVHATWTCNSGKEWAETFIRHNSGTYNNQYVIVDSNKFVRGEKPTTDLIWIIEQFPGMYEMTDVTSILVEDGYWPSVNCPWHQNLYEIAGYPALVASMGIYGGYRSKEGPRWQIMKREASRIRTFEDFKAFMRYNQYYRDTFSQGDPAQQIAARYDLRKGWTPYGSRNAFGDLDSKCLRLTEAVTTMTIHAVASPTFENDTETARIPPWQFEQEADKHVKHDGLPVKWNFTWTTFGADDHNVCAGYDEEACLEHDQWCGWCTFSQTCMVGDKSGPFFEQKCEAGWKVKTEIQSWGIPLIAVACSLTLLFCGFVVVTHFMKKRPEIL